MMKKVFLSMLLFAAACFASDARKVTGSVKCGETTLSSVTVTDGKSFTQTNRNGKFSFDIDDNAEFVYIITPAGYVADWTSGVPAFYRRAEGVSKFEFNLQRTGGGMDYNIVAMADPQVYSDEHFAMFAGEPIIDLAKTAKGLDGVSVGLSLGDICWDRIEILDMYKKEIVRTGIPFYPVIGNHDHEDNLKGDHESSAGYRLRLGPENYAFYLGKDIVIVLDNIIYDANLKMTHGYTDKCIAWVRELLKNVPEEADIYVAQHVPFKDKIKKMKNATQLVEMLRGRKVTFITGHSHKNTIYNIEKNMTDHNVASICGAWWETRHCMDGTPMGYKVFTKHAGKLSWYYKPVGLSSKHMAEGFTLGQTSLHPNSVVVCIWDWDPEWKVEWFEDGMLKGKMDRVTEIPPAYAEEIAKAYEGKEISPRRVPKTGNNFFAANPSRYAKNVTVVIENRFGQKWMQTFDLTGNIEKHLGCSKATLDNIKALVDNGAAFLKLDLVTDINGNVSVGTKDGPLMVEVIDLIDEYTQKEGRSSVGFNFEINTAAGTQEGKTVPYYHAHADFVMKDLWARYMGDRLMITGYDYRSLNHLNEKYPEVDLAFKVAQGTEDVDKAMKRLRFTPKWISFHYTEINEDIIKKYHDKGMLVSAWGITDDKTATMIETLKPDAIIR
ncbi:MAG: calcineurin-like phosphoesterase C-terminal domain-containing protein [Bacteroidales bacterium]|nr:calcineurin-like phosphoesterase C-terminal domain-containing protein [Bacteroidales bacterium]